MNASFGLSARPLLRDYPGRPLEQELVNVHDVRTPNVLTVDQHRGGIFAGEDLLESARFAAEQGQYSDPGSSSRSRTSPVSPTGRLAA